MMKRHSQVILCMAVLLIIGALHSMRQGARSTSDREASGACCPPMAEPGTNLVVVATSPHLTNAVAHRVIAYYFHATIRCETCLQIEGRAKAVIEQQFIAELAANRLVFRSVNYELPENAHYLTDYKLPCPSLVLVCQRNGREESWELLGATWQLAQEPKELDRYIESEVRKFLGQSD